MGLTSHHIITFSNYPTGAKHNSLQIHEQITDSLFVVKPDAVATGLAPLIKARLISEGFVIKNERIGQPTENLIAQHYAHQSGKVLQRCISYLCSGNVVVWIVSGNITKLREVVGATNPIKASPVSIRGQYSKDSFAIADREDRGVFNVVHASDSVENAQKELKLWEGFPHE
jgi:nucleoside-diphosphate kinase